MYVQLRDVGSIGVNILTLSCQAAFLLRSRPGQLSDQEDKQRSKYLLCIRYPQTMLAKTVTELCA
jgi:hypothetical protein